MYRYNTLLCKLVLQLFGHFTPNVMTSKFARPHMCACLECLLTRLTSGKGDRATELTPVAHSCVAVNADLIGAVRPEA